MHQQARTELNNSFDGDAICAAIYTLPQDTARMRARQRPTARHATRGATEAALHRAARGPDARAEPESRVACTQGVLGNQPGVPERAGECGVGRWESYKEGGNACRKQRQSRKVEGIERGPVRAGSSSRRLLIASFQRGHVGPGRAP